MGLRTRNGKWYYRFRLDGRNYAATTNLPATQQNVSKALWIEEEKRQALLEGRRPVRRVVVREFNDVVPEFLEWTKARYRAHPNSGRRIAVSLASARAFFGSEVVSMVDEGKIEAYKAWRVSEHQVRDVTVRHDLHALSVFFQFAIKQGWTRDNPICRCSIPSDAEAVRMHVISAEEEKRYFSLAAKHSDLYDMGRLMINQGCRPEEVLALKKTDIDLDRSELYIRQGKTTAARRTLDLTPESRAVLARRMAGESPWIFPAPRKPGQHIARLNNAHDAVCTKGKFKFCIYDLRHSFATRMAQAGIDLATLAALLGHASLRILQRYVHVGAEHKRAAMQKYAETMETLSTAGRVN